MSKSEPIVVGKLVNFLEILEWAQETAIREEGLRPLHLAFMRRAEMHGGVSYSRIAEETGMPKVEISRAGKFLADSNLATIRSDPKDKRKRSLHLTKFGKCRLEHVNGEFGALVLKRAHFVRSRLGVRFWEFDLALDKLGNFFRIYEADSD
jgi:DNA-binding MarR family transcriptional regulator